MRARSHGRGPRERPPLDRGTPPRPSRPPPAPQGRPPSPVPATAPAPHFPPSLPSGRPRASWATSPARSGQARLLHWGHVSPLQESDSRGGAHRYRPLSASAVLVATDIGDHRALGRAAADDHQVVGGGGDRGGDGCSVVDELDQCDATRGVRRRAADAIGEREKPGARSDERGGADRATGLANGTVEG